jgi:hypothetical protein
MSSKYFIFIIHISIYLPEFSWNFWDLLSIFRALKHFLVFLYKLFCIENIFRKNLLPFQFRPSLWARSISLRPSSQPGQAHPARGNGHHGQGAAGGPSLACAQGELCSPCLFKAPPPGPACPSNPVPHIALSLRPAPSLARRCKLAGRAELRCSIRRRQALSAPSLTPVLPSRRRGPPEHRHQWRSSQLSVF